MNSQNKIILTGVIACIVGVIAGAMAGVMSGSRLGSSIIVQDWVNANANNSAEVIKVLKQFRSDQHEKGLDNLEMHLNRLLIGLSPDYIEGFDLNDETLSMIDNVKSLAQSYRRQYPRPGSEDLLERDVTRFLTDE